MSSLFYLLVESEARQCINVNRGKMKNTNLIVMGVASVAFVVANQIAVNMEVIDPVMYFIGLLGGGGSLVLSIGGLIAEKAERRLSEIEQEESKENSYTPKL